MEVSRGGVPPIRNAPNVDKLLTMQDLIAELNQWAGDALVRFRLTLRRWRTEILLFQIAKAEILEINLNK
jgi:hypothetical protein